MAHGDRRATGGTSEIGIEHARHALDLGHSGYVTSVVTSWLTGQSGSTATAG